MKFLAKLFLCLACLWNAWGQTSSQTLLSPTAFTNIFFSLHNTNQFYRSNNLVYIVFPASVTNYTTATNNLSYTNTQFSTNGDVLVIISGASITNASLQGFSLSGIGGLGATASFIATNGFLVQDDSLIRTYNFNGTYDSNTIATFKDITNVIAGNLSAVTNGYYVFAASQFTTASGTNIYIRPDALITNLVIFGGGTTNDFSFNSTNLYFGQALGYLTNIVTSNVVFLVSGNNELFNFRMDSTNRIARIRDIYTNLAYSFNTNQFSSGTNISVISGAKLTNAALSGTFTSIAGSVGMGMFSPGTIFVFSDDALIKDSTSTKEWNFATTTNANTIARLGDITSSAYVFNPAQFSGAPNNVTLGPGAYTTNLNIRGSSHLRDTVYLQGTLSVHPSSPGIVYWNPSTPIVETDDGRQWNFANATSYDNNTVARLGDVSSMLLTNSITNVISGFNTNQFLVTNGTLNIKYGGIVSNLSHYWQFYVRGAGALSTNNSILTSAQTDGIYGGPGLQFTGPLPYIYAPTNFNIIQDTGTNRYYFTADRRTNQVARLYDITNAVNAITNSLGGTYAFETTQFDLTGTNVSIKTGAATTNLGVYGIFGLFDGTDPLNAINIYPAGMFDYYTVSSGTNIGFQVASGTAIYLMDGTNNPNSIVTYAGLTSYGGPTNLVFDTTQFTITDGTNYHISNSALLTNIAVRLDPTTYRGIAISNLINGNTYSGYPGIYASTTNAPLFAVRRMGETDGAGNGALTYFGNRTGDDFTIGFADTHASGNNLLTNFSHAITALGFAGASDGFTRQGYTDQTATRVGVNNYTPQYTLHMRGARTSPFTSGLAIEYAYSPRTNDGATFNMGAWNTDSAMHEQFKIKAISGPNNNSNSSEIAFQYRTNTALADFLLISTTNVLVKHKFSFGGSPSSQVWTDSDGNLTTVGSGGAGTTNLYYDPTQFHTSLVDTNFYVAITNGALITNLTAVNNLKLSSNSLTYQFEIGGTNIGDFIRLSKATSNYLTLGGKLYINPNYASQSVYPPIILGNNNSAAFNDVILGYDHSIDTAQPSGSSATNADHVVIGRGNTVVGLGNIAIGVTASSTETQAIAVGQQSEAFGAYSVAIGPAATASGSSSIALGYSATADETTSVAIGYAADTTAANQIMLGTSSITTMHPGQAQFQTKVVYEAQAETVTVSETITVNKSYMQLSATSPRNDIELNNGTTTGQLLIVENTSANSITFDRIGSTINPAGKVLTTGDVWTLIWNGSNWNEISFSNK